MPLRYRRAGDADWRDARTENISRSGVLFRADHSVEVQTAIEMVMTLPAELADDTGATVFCRGRVVRTEAPTAHDPHPAVAATLGAYRLMHSQDNDPRRI